MFRTKNLDSVTLTSNITVLSSTEYVIGRSASQSQLHDKRVLSLMTLAHAQQTIKTSCLSKNKTDLDQLQGSDFETRLVKHNLFCLKQGQSTMVKKSFAKTGLDKSYFKMYRWFFIRSHFNLMIVPTK